MAITYEDFTVSGGSTTDFAFTFPYIDTSHVKVSKNGDDLTVTTHYNIVETPSIKAVLTSAAADGDIIRVYRETPGRTASESSILVDFQDGSVLSEEDLDKVALQLLYLAQEANEVGQSSLPIDYSGAYNAGGRRITGVATLPTVDSDAVTRGYVDTLAIYGGAISVPQHWKKTGADLTGTSGDCTIVLDAPVPLGNNDGQFVVSYNGWIQRPETDYTVTENLGTYTFTLKMGDEELADADLVTIINFGVSRNFIEQPFIGNDIDDIPLAVKRFSDVATADLMQWQDEAGGALAKIASDGDATVVDLNATGNADIDLNLNVDGTLTVDGTSTLTGNIDAGAAITSVGRLTVGTDIKIAGTSSYGITSSGSETGQIYFGANGPSIQNDTTIFQIKDGSAVLTAGDLTVDGNITTTTQAADTNNTTVATTAYVQQEIPYFNYVDGVLTITNTATAAGA